MRTLLVILIILLSTIMAQATISRGRRSSRICRALYCKWARENRTQAGNRCYGFGFLCRCICEKVICEPGHRIVGKNNNAITKGWKCTATVRKRGCSTQEIIVHEDRCEPKLCVVPTLDNRATTEPATSVPFPSSVNFTCNDGFRLSLTAAQTSTEAVTCQADGTFSNFTQCCAVVVCTVPTLENASPDTTDAKVLKGTSVTFTCNNGYRLAPSADPTNPDHSLSVTCKNDGTFPAFTKKCVQLIPKDCLEHFTRDRVFADIPYFTREQANIDPSGAGTGGDPFQVDCTKVTNGANTNVRIANSGTDIIGALTYNLPAASCTGTSSPTLFPTTTFTTTISALCDVPQLLTYAANDLQMEELARITESKGGRCAQGITVKCGSGSNSLSLAVRQNFKGSAILHGSNAFVQGTEMKLSHYAYTGGPCSCVDRFFTPVTAGSQCRDGCKCTQNGPGAANEEDSIFFDVSSSNVGYIKSFQVTQHNKATSGTPMAGHFIVRAQPISCNFATI